MIKGIKLYVLIACLYSIFFPYIPSIISSVDTQPNFTIFFIFFCLSILPVTTNSYIKINSNTFYISFFILLFSIFSIYFNFYIKNVEFYPSRLFSFVQFIMAIIFGSGIKFEWKEKYFVNILLIYLIFTVVFFLTSGFLESILIRSRDTDPSLVILTGRGASTLSAESSHFALQIFNIYLIYKLIFGDGINETKIWFLVCILLISSLSGYAFLILIIINLVKFKKYIKIFIFLFIILSIILIFKIIDLTHYRFYTLFSLLSNGGLANLYESDLSFSRRFDSFFIYFRSLYDNLLLGNGFSLFLGGGIISIISAIGIVGIIIYIIIVIRLFKRKLTFEIKFLFFTWLILNTLSGSIGVPAIGFLIGLLFNRIQLYDNKFKYIHEL